MQWWIASTPWNIKVWEWVGQISYESFFLFPYLLLPLTCLMLGKSLNLWSINSLSVKWEQSPFLKCFAISGWPAQSTSLIRGGNSNIKLFSNSPIFSYLPSHFFFQLHLLFHLQQVPFRVAAIYFHLVSFTSFCVKLQVTPHPWDYRWKQARELPFSKASFF